MNFAIGVLINALLTGVLCWIVATMLPFPFLVELVFALAFGYWMGWSDPFRIIAYFRRLDDV